MKEILFNHCSAEYPKLTGWLFSYAGLKLIACKFYANAKWWNIVEFSTGRQVSIFGSRTTTRKETIRLTKAQLDRQGSIIICQAIEAALVDTGILNQ